jgi:uncharacterized protein (DUF362 family)
VSEGFVHIFSVNSNNRTLETMIDVYNDIEQLKDYIRNLTKNELNSKSVNGKKILLKPNWVQHPKRETDWHCLCTHHSFTLAFVELLLEYKPREILIADAPVQSCEWDKLIVPEFLEQIHKLSQLHYTKISIKDLRRVVMHLGEGNKVSYQNSIDEYLIFDLKEKSYLDEISSEENTFRVTHYNPDRFLESHKKGMHKYCITKELFDADIVISMPKSKTHEKTGITNALKNIVGLNGDKDFLPHHRIGSSQKGGDAYPETNVLRSVSEYLYDTANRNLGSRMYWFWVRAASLTWKWSRPQNTDRLGAGWYGNDTTWRMVMDLNQIAYYGKGDGTLGDQVQRKFYSLCDGIVGGQGDGPLTPEPLALGIITFTNDSAWADLSAATLMGINIKKLPLLMAAKDFSHFSKINLSLNGQSITLDELEHISVVTKMPSGWKQYNE